MNRKPLPTGRLPWPARRPSNINPVRETTELVESGDVRGMRNDANSIDADGDWPIVGNEARSIRSYGDWRIGEHIRNSYSFRREKAAQPLRQQAPGEPGGGSTGLGSTRETPGASIHGTSRRDPIVIDDSDEEKQPPEPVLRQDMAHNTELPGREQPRSDDLPLAPVPRAPPTMQNDHSDFAACTEALTYLLPLRQQRLANSSESQRDSPATRLDDGPTAGMAGYTNSPQERDDIIRLYKETGGNMGKIREGIAGSQDITAADEALRIRCIIREAARRGLVELVPRHQQNGFMDWKEGPSGRTD